MATLANPKHRQRTANAAAAALRTLSSRRTAAVVAALLLTSGAYAALQQQKRKKPRKAQRSRSQDGGKGKRRSPQKSLNALVRYLLPIAGRKLLVLLGLAVLRTAMSNRLARLQGYLFRAAFLKRVPLFMRNLGENLALCLVASAIESTAKRFATTMELQWRQKLTDRIHSKYFDNMVYYKLSYVDRTIDNPEQRICEDLPKLCAGLSELCGEVINALVDAAFYAVVLRRYSRTNRYTAAILGYVFGAGVATTVLAPNFGRLFKEQQALEGAYRQLHGRLRSNAESVAFYNGIAKEGVLLRTSFASVLRHRMHLLATQWRFGVVQDFLLKYLGATVAVVLIIGPFFGGHLRPDDTLAGRAAMLSNMRYHTSVVISLFGALGTLGVASRKALKLGAYADRVVELEDRCKAVAGSVSNMAARGVLLPADDEIAFESAVVVTPGNATLVRDLTLRVARGTNLLVTGPNGAGKSSLFRVLGGLWPLADGRIYKPGGAGAGDGLSHEIFYVPQRPYVSAGSLKEQIIYPLSPPSAAATDDVLPDAKLRALLATVDLQYLVDREAAAAAPVNWGEVLSLGEQQRLGMARLFYHRPRFAILDECTSGVTTDMELRFCEAVKALGCTCITISHRPALVAFHDTVLALDGEGGWSVLPGRRDRPEGERWAEEFAASGALAAAGVRGGDAGSCLNGMMGNAGAVHGAISIHGKGVVEEETYAEQAIARAPPFDPNRHVGGDWVPRLAFAPSSRSLWARWRHVLEVLAGGGVARNVQQLGSIAGVVLLRTLLQDRIANLNGASVDLVLRQQRTAFVRLIGMSVLQSSASAVLAPSLRHVADVLAVSWRQRLTEVAHASYLSGNAFYSVSQLGGLRDVDQRLTRDAERLADELAALVPNLVKPVVDVAWFTAQLIKLTGRRGMSLAYLYMVLGFTALRTLTPDFGALAKREHALEGALRNAHTRLRQHAESVAFFGGGGKEGRTLDAHFRALLAHQRRVSGLRWAYLVADDFFTRQLPHNVTWGLTLLYALDAAGDFSATAVQGQLVHRMRYLASVVTQCFTGFGELLALSKRFAELSGGVVRVSEMLEGCDKAARAVQPGLGGRGGDIVFEGVAVVTPEGKLVARELSFQVAPGQGLLVTGPNGSGKTSLFRLLAGLWPIAAGTIVRPASAGAGGRPAVYYVPQRPYTTPGSLREQLVYPLALEDALQVEERRSGKRLDRAAALAALDERLDGLMATVKLSYLAGRQQGGWGAVHAWGEVLSLGEQQRVGMARLFYHRPVFGVLDECTSATSVDVEEALYAHAASLGITLITISQRPALVKYHAQQLALVDGEGDWQLTALAASSSRTVSADK